MSISLLWMRQNYTKQRWKLEMESQTLPSFIVVIPVQQLAKTQLLHFLCILRMTAVLRILSLVVLTLLTNSVAFRVSLAKVSPKHFIMATATDTIETSKFLNPQLADRIRQQFGSPTYVYDEKTLVDQATKALSFPNLYGLNVRYAMKASPNAAILQLFSRLGLNFDASSGFEVRRAVMAGIKPSDISLSSQELPQDFKELVEMGIEFNACSLKQLETFGKLFPGGSCGVRFNPGKGSGGTGKTVSKPALLSFSQRFMY